MAEYGKPWNLHMEWNDLLFLHWAVPVSLIRPLIPKELEIDTWNGAAWIGIVPFTMANVYRKGRVEIPIGASFPELNVRTYVTHGGKPGVWFFSLDAGSLLTVVGARVTFGLPYYFAKMSSVSNGDKVHYRSIRHFSECQFEAEYRPISEVRQAKEGSHEYWLAERYRLYTKLPWGRVARAEIKHSPWPLQDAEFTILSNTMCPMIGEGTTPIAHFAKHLEVVSWSPIAL